MTRVMVDIETLGRSPDSVILSIGAVEFTPDGVGDRSFYRSIDPVSCEEYGLSIEAETLNWWLGQDDEVQDVLTGGGPLDVVLEDFVDWYSGSEVWANSPSFDCAILEEAMKRVGVDVPWTYRHKRDVRTLRELPTGNIETDVEGKEHNALDDARWQAQYVARVLEKMLDEMFYQPSTSESDRTI